MSNIGKRVITASIAAPILLLLVYLGKNTFFLLILSIVLLCCHELYTIMHGKGFTLRNAIGYIAIFFFTVILSLKFLPLLEVTIGTVLTLLTVELFMRKDQLKAIAVHFVGLFYIALPFSTMILLYEQEGYRKVMILFAIVWAADIFGYFGGRYLGGKFIKKKFFERHSPNKTWEGFFSGCLASSVVSGFLLYFLDGHSFENGVLIGFLVGLVSPIGDIIESMFKRIANEKDTSSLLPGHGGVFDRFDSFCFAAPLFWKLSAFF